MEASALRRQRAAVLPRSRRLLGALGDDRLVEQVRRGNAAAFEVIYDRHYRGILSFCRHMLGSRDEAEDALQQTFTSAFTDLQSNDRDIRLKAWLYTIARNRCLSMLRARREQPAEIDDQPTAGLSEEVQQRADLRELLGDLRDLPADQREALVLFELGDLSHAEVANVIGVEPVKVKALVFQARSSLIENREARAIPCAEIREELATATGGALRRGPLRRHLNQCEGCSEYRDRVRSQRRALALVLPVVPTAGLKDSVLAALGFGGGAGGAGAATGGAAGGAAGASAAGGTGALGGGGVFAAFGGASIAKVAVAATIGVGTVAGGGIAVKSSVDGDGPPAAEASAATGGATANGTQPTGWGGGAAPGGAGGSAGESAVDDRDNKKDRDSKGGEDGRAGGGDRSGGNARNDRGRGASRSGRGNARGRNAGNGSGNRDNRGSSNGPRLGQRFSGGNEAGGGSQQQRPPRSNGGGSGGSGGSGGRPEPKPPRVETDPGALTDGEADSIMPPKPPRPEPVDDGTQRTPTSIVPQPE